MNNTQKLEARNQTARAGTLGLALVFLMTTGVPFAATATKSPPGAAPNAVLSDFVASLEGGWAGNENDTPFGKMPFSVLFEWTGPRYAFEMLSALETAVALDSQLAEAYHYLVGYYLNAPPIAGGSMEKAENTAKALAGFDPAGGEQLLSQIADRRKGRPGGGGR